MTFKTQRAANFPTVFLNADHFGEDVSFYPAGGGAVRTVRAKISGSAQRRDALEGEVEVERLRVVVLRDDAAELGGIGDPAVGDQIARPAVDSDGRRYTFTGEIETSRPDHWALIYERRVPVRVGLEQLARG